MTEHTSTQRSLLGRGGRLERLVADRARRGAHRVRRVVKQARRTQPTVSVVLPVYNVEDYLSQCLDSIAAQSFGDYEVLVVDDGSPDGSRAIAERYAAGDRRVTILTRENGGLGAARNTGAAAARGRFLTFVDSDDVLPPHALRALVSSARATGSDIVVGSVRRFNNQSSWRPEWVDDVHRTARSAVRMQEFPPLVRNLYTWDKLFRRDFWDRQGLLFREGVAYEDQPIVTLLLARARSIDVLSDVVYHYRARDDQSSISQQTATVKDLRDRIAAWETSRSALLAEVPPVVYDGWLQTLFDAHFHWYLRSPGTVDDTYWSELQGAVARLTADAPAHVWEATTPDRRVLLELARQDRRADAQELIRQEGQRLEKWPATPCADGVLVHLPFFGDAALDESLFLLRPEQLTMAHSIENFHWLGDPDTPPGTFSMAGWAFIRKVDLATHTSTATVVLRGSSTGTEHAFAASARARPAFAPPAEDSWCDYEAGTFHVEVPLGNVLAAAEEPETWEVLLRVTAAGFTVTVPVTHLVRSGSAGVIPAATLANGDRVIARWRVHEPLCFRLHPLALHVSDVRLQGRVLSGLLEGPVRDDLTRVQVVSGADRASVPLDPADGSARRFRLTLPASSTLSLEEPTQWDVTAVTLEERSVGLTLADALPTADASDPAAAAAAAAAAAEASPAEGALTVQRSRNGQLGVTEWVLGAWAESLSVSAEGVVRIGGSVRGSGLNAALGDGAVDGVASVSLATRHLKTRAFGEHAPVVGGRFQATLTLEHELHRFGRLPLPTGDHDFTLRVHPATSGADATPEPPLEVPLRMSQALSGELPVAVQTSTYEGSVVRGPDGMVRVSLIRPIGDARGRYHQQRLRTAARSAGLTRGVLMRSYFGESATDNGVSIQRELRRRGSDLPVYWAVQDYSVPVPPGGIPVVGNSREWYELISSVAYYVDNMYQPDYHSKPAGQVVVQTFHGYPFKVMGHPHWRNLRFSQARISAYDDRAREWDHLLSPAKYATPLLRRDFAYDGDVLEIGYPRNDVLQSPEAEEIRAVTRGSLGLAEGQTAVLYAPTFRDYLAKGDNVAAMADFFDFRAATQALGEGTVILVRGHAFNARSRQRVGSLPGTVDVTDYPEVSDLYLAADAAVVDYSSLRFDFGVTGKPMIFHVPDLQRYQDTRGWLFDFEPSAPGPLVSTTEEVVEQLCDLDGVRTRHREQYAAFKSAYLDLEDGYAGRRFVDAVFGARGDA